MNEPGFSPVRHLDPAAQEFFPATTIPPQIFYPYAPPPPPPPTPPPLYDNMGYAHARPHFPSPPAYVSAAAEPPPPLPVSLPPASTTPSRTLLLSMVPTSVSESTVRRELEVFGDVRAVQMERRREGLVTVHFYDVRDAQTALMAIQEQHMQQQFRLGRHYDAVLNNNSMALMAVAPPLPPQAAPGLISGRVVWAQFTTPVTSGLPDGNNQGTLVVFNLDPGVSASCLKQIFEEFGPVKELRETPNKRNQRFVEFYDVRNAAKAMAGMNGKEIYGKALVIEFSRPGGQSKKSWRGPLNGTSSNKFNSPTSSTYNYLSRNTSRSFPPSSSSSSHSTRPPPPMESNLSITPRNYRWKGNPSGSDGSKSSSSGSSLHESVTNLSISTGYEECSSVRRHKKISSKKGSSSASSSGRASKQPSHSGCRPWKSGGGGGGGGAARRGKDHDPRFLINQDAIVESNCRDTRTTVMIKNIPNKYSQKLLLNMLDNHCIHCNEQLTGGDDDQPLSSYDFVYLPIDFINKCNVGYGFVNMTSPEATLRLYKAFHHQNWEVFNSRKICEVTYARLQGLEALREHFKNSKFPGDAEEYMPVVFSPPRDGRTVTDPVPIVGRVASSPQPLPLSPHSSAENQSEPPCEEVNGNASYDDEDDDGDGGNYGPSGGCSYDENDE